MKHTPRSRDVAKAAVSLGTGTATIAAFAATGALAGSMVTAASASTPAAASSDTAATTDPSLTGTTVDLTANQQLADQLAQTIQDRKTQLRKLDRLITRAKKAAKRHRIATRQATTSTSTSTSSGSTSTKTTTTTTKTSSPPPAKSSGS